MGRRWGTAFALSWLLLMVVPAWGLYTSGRAAASVATGLLGTVAFCGLYAWAWLRRSPWRRDTAALLPVLGLTAIALALILAAGPEFGSTLIYCSVLAAASLAWRPGLVAVAAYALLTALLAIGFGLGFGFAAAAFLEFGLIGVGMVGVMRLVTANIELRHAREEILRLALAEERLRFARDLHDLLGHSLSVIVLKAELASKLAGRDPGQAAAQMAEVEQVARQALGEVREAVAGYRHASLAQELEGAGRALEAAGITAETEQAAGPLPAAAEAVLAWTLREAVTNVVRHSGARRCRIRLWRQDGQARLEVEDDGRGGQSEPGSGLRGIQERVDALNGRVEAGSPAGGGFRLRVSLPA